MHESIIQFRVNGEPVTCRAEARQHLGDCLRNDLQLTGTHLGCEHGVCGACSVLVDGALVRSCLLLTPQAEDTEVTTVEGLAADPIGAVLQSCFVERNALQCGFCTAGMLMTAVALLRRNADPARHEIREELSGNYCRCTGYEAIVDAIENAAQRLRSKDANLAAKDLSQGHIGQPVARSNARNLVAGLGRFTDDIDAPRQLHMAFLRSPVASARVARLDVSAAAAMPGVERVLSACDLRGLCAPWRGVLNMFDMQSPEQVPLADGRVLWQGQPIAAVLASSRALAEDAVGAIELDLEETPAVIGVEAALAPYGPRVHPELSDNVCLRYQHESPEFAQSFAGAAVHLKRNLSFARHTGVPLEPRAILAEFNPAKRTLLVHLSHQAPHMMRDLFAKHFSLPVNDVRVVCPDVGGGFGIKVHCYPEEMAAVAASMLCGRPVRYAADRAESFGSDIHAREHEIQVEVALHSDGTLVGFDLHDHALIGAYSAYPRTSVLEGFMINRLTGAPYRHASHRAVMEVLFQNKVPTSQYRSVGHPVLCATAEVMLDHAARQLGIDPVALRLRNVIPDAKQPHLGPSGFPFVALSHEASLHKLIELMGYEARRAEQARAREEGRLVGIGVSVLSEITGMGVSVYAQGGAPISSQDGAIVRLETDGSVTCIVCVADQGQGSDTAMAQIAATRLGVNLESVRVLHGDTGAVPMGGGAYGSRTVAIAGEAVLLAADQLRQGILAIAASKLEQPVESLSVRGNEVFVMGQDQAAMTLSEVAQLGLFRQDLLPKGFQSKLLAAATYVNPGAPMFTNCVQASMVEVDPRFGTVRLLKHWVVEDCGTVVNPLTADEQVRGAVVQGLGMALYEQCIYSHDGQLLTATLADYLVPMAAEMPDIEVAHVVTRTPLSTLGAKGAAEAGTGGAPAAVMNAVNDALAPLGAEVARFPITPESVLRALGKF